MAEVVEAPSIFASYNARSLQPGEVAKSFVPSDSFEQLCGLRHAVILGPRGSGKTTLLKMLQIPALEVWAHARAEELVAGIDFIGVFVPFDRSWQAQFEALGRNLSMPARRTITRAAFTTHVLRALLSTLLSRVSPSQGIRQVWRHSLGPVDERELAKSLFRLWVLDSGPQSLLGIRLALSQRLGEIGRLAGRLNFLGEREQAKVLGEIDYLHLNFVDSVTVALDAWESVTQEPQRHWALLFDELELAPESIKLELFQSIRSTDSRLLFKLALSPYDGDIHLGQSPRDPQPSQDYDEIMLWFAEKRSGLAFCEALWNSLATSTDGIADPPAKRLGRSLFETEMAEWSTSEWRTAYRRGTRKERSFRELARFDKSFRAYLHKRGIAPTALQEIAGGSRAAEIRKIAPLVEARLFFLRDVSAQEAIDGRGRRGRKTKTLYSGWESLCAVTEGNPRVFIATVRWILSKAPKREGLIPRAIQADAIDRASNRFRAMLRTVPVSDSVARTKNRGLLSLLDALGAYFRRKQIDDAFVPEPVGSFVVDSTYGDDMLRAVGQALNTGALIYVGSGGDENVLSSLRGKRFRLSYLLAAHYGLVPRLGRSISLRRILSAIDFESIDQIALDLRLRSDS